RVNLSTNTNEVLRLASEDDVLQRNNQPAYTGDFTSTITQVGDPIYSFYGFQTMGLFQSDAEIAEAPTQENAVPGDVRFVDLNGDGVISADDRTIIGSYLPDFTYGVSFGASYGNFDFSLFLQGSQGNDVYNGMASLLSQTNRLFNGSPDRLLDAWTPQNPNTNTPRIALNDPNNNRRVSDRFVEDGSYMRVKNLTIGYNFPFSDGPISSLRLSLTGQNLITVTGYSGLDPEISGNLSSTGFDNGVYPQARSLIFGAQVGF
ncbi:MAG: SusC/RagA family TonB-linked outer membrane protein, partial [Bacteroidota bacterium]